MHMELYESRMCLERLAASLFPMFENLSQDTTSARAKNLTLRKLDQLVVHKDYFAKDSMTEDYEKVHEILPEISRTRRVADREFIVRLGFSDCNLGTKKDDKEVMTIDEDMDLDAGLTPASSLNVMKIMGAIVHPLLHNKKRMVAAGLCTDGQYESGKTD